MADYRRDPPKPRGRPNYSINSSHEDIVRSFIRNANKNGQYITTSSIYDLLMEREPEANFHRATFGVRVWLRYKVSASLRDR